MREIKFRAWDVNGKGFIAGFIMYGFALGLGNIPKRLSRYGDEWKEKDFILMQFTGLPDKNGKEIYEGDIVKCEKPEEVLCFTAVVRYHDEGSIGLAFQQLDSDGHFCSIIAGDSQYYEVIGNIHENPEFIKD